MLNKEQKEFVINNMKNVIKMCKEDIKKYGYNDEATAGVDDCIEQANNIIIELSK